MIWDLPIDVEINGKRFAICNKCDYRVVLSVIRTLEADDISDQEKIAIALMNFYEDLSECTDGDAAYQEMLKIINLGEEPDNNQANKPRLMNWEHDFAQIAPPINRVLGYSVRDPEKWTHWYDFVGAYMEIGECMFSTIISIRSKKAKGKKLEKHEQEFYAEHRKLVDLPIKLTAEELAELEAF